MTNEAAAAGAGDPAAGDAPAGAPGAPDTPDPSEASDAPGIVETHEQVEVGLVRSVRYGRIILTATVLVAILGMIVALLFPVAEGAEYSLGQIVGLMAVVGAIVGLVLGALLALALGLVARRRRGAALAIQVDVQ